MALKLLFFFYVDSHVSKWINTICSVFLTFILPNAIINNNMKSDTHCISITLSWIIDIEIRIKHTHHCLPKQKNIKSKYRKIKATKNNVHKYTNDKRQLEKNKWENINGICYGWATTTAMSRKTNRDDDDNVEWLCIYLFAIESSVERFFLSANAFMGTWIWCLFLTDCRFQ